MDSLTKLPARTRLALVVGLALLCIHTGIAQDLYVCKIQGRVLLDSTVIKLGDKININDRRKLRFSSARDYVVVISPEQGRCVLSPNASQKQDHHLWAFLKDTLVPCSKMRSLYTRGSDYVDINDFIGDGRLVMLDSIRIPLVASYTDDYRTSVFVFTYSFDDKPIERLLPIRPTYPYLVLDDSIFTVDGKLIDPGIVSNFSLNLRDNDLGLTRGIATFKITSLRNVTTHRELQTAYEGLRLFCGGNSDKLVEEMYAHISEYYGQIDKASLLKFMQVLKG